MKNPAAGQGYGARGVNGERNAFTMESYSPSPDLSPDQREAMRAIERWFIDPLAPQVFRLFGGAGTGKTWVVKGLPELLELPRTVLRDNPYERDERQAVSGWHYAALAGKAAEVLRSKGCEPSSTIHSLIYRPLGEIAREELTTIRRELDGCADSGRRQELLHAERYWVERLHHPEFVRHDASELGAARLLVADECSMIDETTATDLLSFGVRTIVIGDPFQLPPVDGGAHFMGVEPDALLTHIHRQAEGSDVLAMATRVRAGEGLALNDYRYLGINDLLRFDQVLCGRNATRWSLIHQLRTAAGRVNWYPVPGDRLICLHNNREAGVFKGQLFEVIEARPGDAGEDRQLIRLTLLGDNNKVYDDVRAPWEAFTGFEGERFAFSRQYRSEKPVLHMTFANAITVHKAQGSEWKSVALVDESWCWKREGDTSRRWLYTGITRASHEIAIMKAWR